MLKEDTVARLRALVRDARSLKERVIWGGEGRERLLLRLLGGHYESRFRRLWVFGREEPHFTDHRVGSFQFAFAEEPSGPERFYRGFFSSELLRKSDRVLDIGCGDGFFTKRFFSTRCAAVDAVDIEPSAIAESTRTSAAPNIRYLRLDAVNEPFPAPKYDVVVWDGAIGHFAAQDTDRVLRKIQGVLEADGVFTGSESLGREEGHDHLQFFDSLDDMGTLLRGYWRYVQLREVSYPLRGGFVRREGYWRCSDDEPRLAGCGWRPFEAGAR